MKTVHSIKKYSAVVLVAIFWTAMYYSTLSHTAFSSFYGCAILLLSGLSLMSTFFLAYSITAKEQTQFFTAFAIGLGGKFFLSLIFLVYHLFWVNGLTSTQVLYFFGMYFSFTGAILYGIAKK